MMRRGQLDTQHLSLGRERRGDWRYFKPTRETNSLFQTSRRRKDGFGARRKLTVLGAKLSWRLALGVLLVVFLAATALTYTYLSGEESSNAEDKTRPAEDMADSHDPSEAFCDMVRSSHEPLVCAHGGDSTSTTPNTKHAFFAAMKQLISCVEVDVAASRDGKLFVLHKRELELVLNQKDLKPSALRGRPARVEEFDSGEITAMRMPGGQRILQAKDIVQVLNKDERIARIILDVKTYRTTPGGAENEEEMVDAVGKMIEDTECFDKCLVWAKSDGVVRGMHSRLPQIKLGMTVMNETQENRAMGLDVADRLESTCSPEYVATHWASATTDFVRGAHARLGKLVYGWTANTDDITNALLDSAVDGIVTNFPAKVRTQINQMKAKCGE